MSTISCFLLVEKKFELKKKIIKDILKLIFHAPCLLQNKMYKMSVPEAHLIPLHRYFVAKYNKIIKIY